MAVRVEMTQNLVYGITGQLSFDPTTFGLKTQPEYHSSCYYRETPGQDYSWRCPPSPDWVTRQLQADMPGFGEFALGFRDEAEVPYPPLLATPGPECDGKPDRPDRVLVDAHGLRCGLPPPSVR